VARWLVRFGYDGGSFSGWARQPNLRTVEGEILEGLARSGNSSDVKKWGVAVASRTDRGVSARGNALALSTNLPGQSLLRALNGISPDIFFTAATPVADELRVRSAVRRIYRFYEPATDRDFGPWRDAAALIRGPVDVRSFGRSIPAANPTWRTVESVAVTPRGKGAVVEVRAPSFVWGMVRKIVGALREHEAGRLSLGRLEAAVHGREIVALPLAEPEPLVLWEVEYPFPWAQRWAGPTRYQVGYLRAARGALRARSDALRVLEREVGEISRRPN
jgi:tRNA pseudouridine38-40 synthase